MISASFVAFLLVSYLLGSICFVVSPDRQDPIKGSKIPMLHLRKWTIHTMILAVPSDSLQAFMDDGFCV
jgi:hypothetical protein